MYPLAEGKFAPENQWYIAAWSDEIGREPMERWILDKPVAFYRREDGRAVALEGRCPHRGFPLGKSDVVGDRIKCGYHGIQFGPDGRCHSIPTQAVVPNACSVKSYPLVEQWRWLWIWMGDPELADESMIPSEQILSLNDGLHTIASGAHALVEGRYMLLHDNLFDLTHVGHLHAKSFGGGAGAQDTIPEIMTSPGIVGSLYTQRNVDCPPVHAAHIGYFGKIDRYQGLTCYLPCLHVGGQRFNKVGTDEMLASVKVYHGITPATRHSTHYFLATGQTWSKDVAASQELLDYTVEVVLPEDIFATESIEQMVQKNGGRIDEILLRADKVCVTARRAMQALIDDDDRPAGGAVSIRG